LSQTKPDDGWLRDARSLDLDVKEYSAEQSLNLVRVSRKRSLAEEHVALRQLKEISAVRKALPSLESENKPTAYRKAQQVLAVARAVHRTLSAEKRLADLQLKEAELRLQASHDAVDTVNGKFILAEQQLGELLNEMDSRGLLSVFPTDPDDRDDSDDSSVPHQPQHSKPCSDDSGSDVSGLESFYDTKSDGEGS
jgi:hypothetical protein